MRRKLLLKEVETAWEGSLAVTLNEENGGIIKPQQNLNLAPDVDSVEGLHFRLFNQLPSFFVRSKVNSIRFLP